MDEREEAARLRDEEHRAEFAIRRDEERMAAEARQLAREMKDFEDAEQQVEREIEGELRKEHWGLEPERPPNWQAGTD